MALIKCPECQREVSDKAISCPNCGVPISTLALQIPEIIEPIDVADENLEFLECPSFSEDMRIGQQITNWALNAAFKGVYNQAENVIKSIPSGEAQVLLHTHGLRIMVGFNMYDIHNSQIINIIKTSSAEIAKVNKSVIGRAVVGGLIMGPLGAIVGGISGVSLKDKLQITQYVIINFWDTSSKTSQSILLSCDMDQPIDAFILRQQKEQYKNETEDRVVETESTPIWMVICIIVIIISVIMIFMNL